MADPVVRYNVVAFVVNGVRFPIKLDQAWRRTCGIAPDVNSGVCSYAVFDKLQQSNGNDLKDLVGEVHFFSAVNPMLPPLGGAGSPEYQDWQAAPDMPTSDVQPSIALADIRLMHVEVSRWENVAPVVDGVVQPATGVRAAEYRLTFADCRRDYVAPWGGYLTDGEINKLPLTDGGAHDANENDLKNPQQLARRCLLQMGLDPAIAPNSLSDLAKPFNVEWRGNHAPTELAKILKEANHVIHVTADGIIRIHQIGLGLEPNVDQADLIATLPLPTIDRRGEVVVFTSAPNASIETRTIEGFDDADGDETIEYVIQDTDDQWKPLVETAWFQHLDPIEQVKNNFKDVPEKYKARVAAQLFRCIMLNKYQFASLLVSRYRAEEGYRGDVELLAKIMVRNVQGVWENAQDYVRVPVVNIVNDGTVIQVHELLLQTEKPSLSPVEFPDRFGIQKQGIKLRMTHEATKEDDNGDPIPSYYEIGYRQLPDGSLRKITGKELDIVLADPDTFIARRPDLRLSTVYDANGNAKDNQGQLGDISLNLAEAFFKGRGSQPRTVVAQGFVGQANKSLDLNGIIGRIEYDQDQRQTRWEVYNFWLPGGDLLYQLNTYDRQDVSGGGGKYPHQGSTQGARIADGTSGHVQPAVTVTAPPPAPPGKQPVKVKIAGSDSGRGKYYGGLVKGASTAGSDDPLAEPEGMTDPTANDALILNLREDKTLIGNTGPDHMLAPGYYMGMLAGGGTGGATVEIDSDRCACGNDNTLNKDNVDTSDESAVVEPSITDLDRKCITITPIFRVVYNAGGAQSLFAFFREMEFHGGKLVRIGPEQKVTVFTTGPCSG
jgi:hypothetical protein